MDETTNNSRNNYAMKVSSSRRDHFARGNIKKWYQETKINQGTRKER